MLAFQVEFFCFGDATQKQQLRLQEKEAVDDLPPLRMWLFVLSIEAGDVRSAVRARAGAARVFATPRALIRSLAASLFL